MTQQRSIGLINQEAIGIEPPALSITPPPELLLVVPGQNSTAFSGYVNDDLHVGHDVSITEYDNYIYVAVAYSPELDRWVMIGESAANGFAYSHNGKHWYTIPSPFNVFGGGIVWCDTLNLFVAVGSQGGVDAPHRLVFTSPDGITWTGHVTDYEENIIDGDDTVYLGLLTNVGWSHSNGTILAGGQAPYDIKSVIMKSSNGIDWTTIITDPFYATGPAIGAGMVCYSEDLDRWIVGSGDAVFQDGTSLIYSDDDGETWTAAASNDAIDGIEGRWGDACWSPEVGLFVIVSTNHPNGQDILISSDGINWSVPTTPPSGTGILHGVCWSPHAAKFFVSDQFGTVWKSSDGEVWTDTIFMGFGGGRLRAKS